MGSSSSDSLVENIGQTIISWNLIERNDHILVALSGGMDSMTLLTVLVSFRDDPGYKISAACIDHKVRPESGAELEFLMNHCETIGVPFYSREIDHRTRDSGLSPEEWMRRERYISLESIRESINADWIATGHHADDNAETILFRLSRGSGLKGLLGIPPVRDNIIRPMLNLSRAEIKSWAEMKRIPVREDKSNEDLRIPRNFLRHELLATWKEYYPSVLNGIVMSANHLREIQDALLHWESDLIKKIETLDEDSYSISRNWFDPVPAYMRVRVLFKIISETMPLSRNIWYDLKTFLAGSDVGSTLALPEDWILLNERKSWILSRKFYPENASNKVNLGVATECGHRRLMVTLGKNAPGFTASRFEELVDADRIDMDSLVVRPWKHGDSFIPLGMKTHKKVSDFLTDNKVSRWQKERQFVLTSNEQIIWVCGMRICDTVKVTDRTKHFLKLLLT